MPAQQPPDSTCGLAIMMSPSFVSLDAADAAHGGNSV
jgi:hypothetical protein